MHCPFGVFIQKWSPTKTVHEIGQQKQVLLPLNISFLFFLSFWCHHEQNSLHRALLSHIISLPWPTRHLFLCSQERLLNLHKCPLALVNLHNQMNPNLCLPACTTRYSLSLWTVETDWLTIGSWLLILSFNSATIPIVKFAYKFHIPNITNIIGAKVKLCKHAWCNSNFCWKRTQQNCLHFPLH